MSLRETLDDAAERAMAGRRVDPVAVLATVARRDPPMARLRRRAPLVALVVAAAAALVLVAVLVPSPRADRVPPAAPLRGPTGLPTRLDAPPPWTPLVTDQPVEAASVIFPGEVVHGPGTTGVGLFVLSADGRQYRRLPWTAELGGGLYTLSADGRWAAWTDAGAGSTVHVLRLRDGLRRDLRLAGAPSGGSGVQASLLVFLPRAEGLVVVGPVRQAGGDFLTSTWRADLRSASPSMPEVCQCDPGFGLASDGTVYRSGSGVPGLADLPELPAADQLDSALDGLPVAVSPDRAGWAQGIGDAVLRVARSGAEATTQAQPAGSNPRVLGWGARGVLVQWQPAGGSSGPPARLVWVDPQRGGRAVLADLPAWTAQWRPVPAAGLVGTGTAIPTARPAPGSWWSHDHLRYLAGRALGWLLGLLGVAAIAALPWTVRRLRRRDGTTLAGSTMRAGDQGRLW